MDEYDTVDITIPKFFQNGLDTGQLNGSETSRRLEEWRWDRGTQANQGHPVTHAHSWKIPELRCGVTHCSAVSDHVGRPVIPGTVRWHPHVGVVIAGNQRYRSRWPQFVEPLCGLDEFALQGNVGQVARNRYVIRALAKKVREQRFENFRPMRAGAAEIPGQPAKKTLSDESCRTRAVQSRRMPVGDVSQCEQSTPPRGKQSLSQPEAL